jgi:hypothetical protein
MRLEKILYCIAVVLIAAACAVTAGVYGVKLTKEGFEMPGVFDKPVPQTGGSFAQTTNMVHPTKQFPASQPPIAGLAFEAAHPPHGPIMG